MTESTSGLLERSESVRMRTTAMVVVTIAAAKG
jgi:hypothetical protein